MGGSGELVLREVNGWTVGFREGEDEPLVRDLDLAERLGYERPRAIRELIDRHVAAKNLNDSDVRRTARRTQIGIAERNVEEFWLTETGALFIATKSETPTAVVITKELIAVYMLARRGGLQQRREAPIVLDDAEAQVRLLALRQREALSMYAVIPGLYDPEFLRHKTEHAAALVTGEKPAIENPLLDVSGYLRARGLTAAELKSKGSSFGKRVKALFITSHGEAPKKLPRDVNGSSREVYSYTERDRPLFDQAFAEMFGAAIVAAASGGTGPV